MTWFRTKLKHGATLALMALAINLALAFGHRHLEGSRGPQVAIAALTFSTSSDGSIPVNGDDDGCAICKAVAAMGTALAPVPPALPVALSHIRLDLAPPSELAVRQCARSDFRARGPPLATSQT